MSNSYGIWYSLTNPRVAFEPTGEDPTAARWAGRFYEPGKPTYTGFVTLLQRSDWFEAEAIPHCDMWVLHAPGACEFCDELAPVQAARARLGINFTAETDPAKDPCPAMALRPTKYNVWGGNRPSPPPSAPADGCRFCGAPTSFRGLALVCPKCGPVGGL